MAVLVETLSVVIRHEAIGRAFPGGWTAFDETRAPNRTLCSDGELMRVGFMALADAEAYIAMLEARGLVFQRNGQSVDLALVHQLRGLALPTPWLEVGTLHINGCPVVACWLAGQEPASLAVPPDWKYEGSLSQHPCLEGEPDDDRIKFLRHQDGVDVYLNLVTGKELYVGRTVIEGETVAALSTQLEQLCRDALNLASKNEELRALGNAEGLAPLFAALQEQLLPEAERIANGPGRNMALAHLTRGLILRILNRLVEAEAALRKSNELRPGAISTLQELVRCLSVQGKHHDALPFAREAVKVAPVDAAAWGNLALCLLKLGEREEAQAAIRYAIDLEPQDPINRYIRDNFERLLKSK